MGAAVTTECVCTCHGPDDDWPDWCDDCGSVHEADLAQVCRDELRSLWQDMAEASRHAINTNWSINMGHIAHRIARLSRHVGALPWSHVSVHLLRGGIYEKVHNDAGLTYPPIDWERVALTERRIEERRQQAVTSFRQLSAR